jgi:hypothetical protein
MVRPRQREEGPGMAESVRTLNKEQQTVKDLHSPHSGDSFRKLSLEGMQRAEEN